MEALIESPWIWVLSGGLVVTLVYWARVTVERRVEARRAVPLHDDIVEGLMVLIAGDRRRAEQLFASAAEASPSNPVLFLAASALLLQRGEGGRAARLLEGLLARRGLEPVIAAYAHEKLVEALVRIGRHDEARRRAADLRNSEGLDAARVERRARLAIAAHAYDVVEELQAVVERRSRDRGLNLAALSLAARAEESADAGRRDEALKLVRKAVAKDPNLAAARALEGELLLQEGRLDKARTVFLEALALEPGLGLAVYPALEEVHMERGQVAAYEAMVQARLESDPRDPVALWAIGAHWLRRRHLEEGARALSESVEISPRFTLARRALRAANAAMGKELPAESPFDVPSATLCSACGTPGVKGIVHCPVCGQVGTIVFTLADAVGSTPRGPTGERGGR